MKLGKCPEQVADGLFAIALAIDKLANAIEKSQGPTPQKGDGMLETVDGNGRKRFYIHGIEMTRNEFQTMQEILNQGTNNE